MTIGNSQRFEPGTPVVYTNIQGEEITGEVVVRKEVKGIGEYSEIQNHDSFIIPDNWDYVETFQEATERKSK